MRMLAWPLGSESRRSQAGSDLNSVQSVSVLALASVDWNVTRSVLSRAGAEVRGFPSSRMSASTSAEDVVRRYGPSPMHSSRRQSAVTSGECLEMRKDVKDRPKLSWSRLLTWP